MFNADGSRGAMCLNGLRCVAHYLLKHYNFPNKFFLHISDYQIPCTIETHQITLAVSFARYEKPLSIIINNQKISGHCIHLGNPHFVIVKPATNAWLNQYAPLIEKHEAFPDRTNVDCVWPSPDETQKHNHQTVCSALFFERGSGHTLSCGSGAAAIMVFLHQEKHIVVNQTVSINTEGGEILSYIDDNHAIIQTTDIKQSIGINIHDSHLSCFTDKWKRILQLEDD